MEWRFFAPLFRCLPWAFKEWIMWSAQSYHLTLPCSPNLSSFHIWTLRRWKTPIFFIFYGGLQPEKAGPTFLLIIFLLQWSLLSQTEQPGGGGWCSGLSSANLLSQNLSWDTFVPPLMLSKKKKKEHENCLVFVCSSHNLLCLIFPKTAFCPCRKQNFFPCFIFLQKVMSIFDKLSLIGSINVLKAM